MENKESIGIDYEMEYFRLKDVEKENKELKETLINLTKLFVNRNNALERTIKDIDRNLRLIVRKWGKQMTLNYVHKKVTEFMTYIQSINLYEISSSAERRANQKKLNDAYKHADNFRAEIERERIKNKQKRGGTNDRYKNTWTN